MRPGKILPSLPPSLSTNRFHLRQEKLQSSWKNLEKVLSSTFFQEIDQLALFDGELVQVLSLVVVENLYSEQKEWWNEKLKDENKNLTLEALAFEFLALALVSLLLALASRWGHKSISIQNIFIFKLKIFLKWLDLLRCGTWC